MRPLAFGHFLLWLNYFAISAFILAQFVLFQTKLAFWGTRGSSKWPQCQNLLVFIPLWEHWILVKRVTVTTHIHTEQEERSGFQPQLYVLLMEQQKPFTDHYLVLLIKYISVLGLTPKEPNINLTWHYIYSLTGRVDIRDLQVRQNPVQNPAELLRVKGLAQGGTGI